MADNLDMFGWVAIRRLGLVILKNNFDVRPIASVESAARFALISS